ncbi:uncharacterized protein LOC141606420 [Silene latifolia]|uniref:uncharacterized protein LOC141606420 n=1 Tax=Silene latifolia TaxID=37657 RepID=UPI003D76D32E
MSRKKASMSFLFFLLISITLSSSFSSAEYDSVYDLLKAYGLPKGIIPKGVAKNDFTFDSTSGKLQINLSFLEGNQVCKVTRTQYFVYNRVELQSTISATVQYQRLFDIEGITATVSIAGIIVLPDVKIVELVVSKDGKTLQFKSRFPFLSSPKFPITDEFDVPQTCEADLTVSPINMVRLFGVGIVEMENQDDSVDNYPLFFNKRALGGRA